MTFADGPPLACTITARNYLPFARTLASSYLEHHPGGTFVMLVVDGPPDHGMRDSRIEGIGPEALRHPHLQELCFKYDVIELCTALKPTLLRSLLRERGAGSAVYLDPDILVCRTLSEIPSALASASLLLTPHNVRPIPLDGRRPTEMDVLMTGAYNLGFLAVSDCAETFAFLDWWEQRLRDGCRMDPSGRYFVDQKWVDLAPSLFPSTALLRDETYNVATWNLHSRALEQSGESFFVNGRPLSFFHFSGFEPRERYFRSQPAARIAIEPDTPLASLTEMYARRVEGHAASDTAPYGYACFSDGLPIAKPMRALYASLPEVMRERFGNPFHAEPEASFFRWATTPDVSIGDLSPFVMAVYRARPDVMAAFPDVWGVHREAFVHWIVNTGCQEMGIDPETVRVPGAPPTPTPAPDAPAVGFTVARVALSRVISQRLIGRWLDLPRSGQIVTDGTLPLSGWVLGRSEPLIGIDVVESGVVIAEAPLAIGRPDVAGSFPDVYHAVRCGFRTSVSVRSLDGGELVLRGMFADRGRVTIASLKIEPYSRVLWQGA
jgi:hypothetical protein